MAAFIGIKEWCGTLLLPVLTIVHRHQRRHLPYQFHLLVLLSLWLGCLCRLIFLGVIRLMFVLDFDISAGLLAAYCLAFLMSLSLLPQKYCRCY
jgi:hypothetical protein